MIWKTTSRHVKDTAIIDKSIQYKGQPCYVAHTGPHYWLLNHDQSSCLQLQYHEYNKLLRKQMKDSWGPFDFYYGFETSDDGKYVIEHLPYLFHTTNKVKSRIRDIVAGNAMYIQLNMPKYQLMQDMVKYYSPQRIEWMLEV